MSDTQLPIEHLCTITLDGIGIGGYGFMGATGARRFRKATGGSVIGARLNGRVLPLHVTDYARVSADGQTTEFDADVGLQLDDGTAVLMQFRGRASPRYGVGGSRMQILFKVSEGPHAWIQGMQAIGYGEARGEDLAIEVYALANGFETASTDGDHAGTGANRRHAPATFLFRRKSEHVPGSERYETASRLGSRYFTLAEGGGKFKGPEIEGDFISGYSWSPHFMSVVGEDYLVHFDVKTLLETSDNVPILMSYFGVRSRYYDGSPGDQLTWRTAILFDVAQDSAYAWLGGVQAVGIGRWAGDGAEYKVYTLD